MTKKNKPTKCKTKTPKKRRVDDTLDEDEQEPKEAPSKETVSNEQPSGLFNAMKESMRKLNPSKEANKKKSKEGPKETPKETPKDKTSREKKPVVPVAPVVAQSAEKTEREKPQQLDPALKSVIVACKGFCKYLLDMKESSLSTYFDGRLAKYAPPNHTFTESDKNAAKNRSKQHKLNDNGRVHIDIGGKDSYINASHIRFDPSCQEYIMTQYPLKSTIHDFWRMVSQKKVSRIITIFDPFADEAIEEFCKIPSTISPLTTSSTNVSVSGMPSVVSQKSQTRDQIIGTSIRCETNQIKSFFPLFTDHYMNLDNWLINTRKVEIDEKKKEWMSMYTVEIVAAECSEANYIRVFNCTTWPWKTLPLYEKDMKLLALVRAPCKDDTPLVAKSQKTEPIVVMCDLGLDRSATVVLCSVIIEQVLAGKIPDCDALFKKMRDQRANCFTMSMYYTYAIRAALSYLQMKLKDTPGDVNKMIEKAMEKVPFVYPKK